MFVDSMTISDHASLGRRLLGRVGVASIVKGYHVKVQGSEHVVHVHPVIPDSGGSVAMHVYDHRVATTQRVPKPLLVLALRLGDEVLRDDLPHADPDLGLRLEVVVDGAIESLIFGLVKVNQFGPLDPRQKDDLPLNVRVEVKDGGQDDKDEDENEDGQADDGLDGPERVKNES